MLKKVSFTSVLYEWLNTKKTNVKESTYLKYLWLIENNIAPFLKDITFKDLNFNHIESFFNLENIKRLSNSTKNCILIIIKSAISYGVDKRYRKHFEKINLKFTIKNNEITCFSKIEQKMIINYINQNMNLRNLLILFALFTGARIGEICSLKGTDFDFINNTVSINKTVQRIKDSSNNKNKTKLIIGNPKSTSSIRIIPVPEFIINLLEQYIQNKNLFVFTGSNTPKDPRTVEKYFSCFLKKISVRNLNFHSLRHSYATRLMEEKVDIKVISELLGHSDWKITQSIYIHSTIDYKRDSVNKLIRFME